MSSIQELIKAADKLNNQWKAYRVTQVKYFQDQTLVNLNALRDAGKLVIKASEDYDNLKKTKK